MEVTTFLWMFVVLKIPIVAALVLIWYAIREPEPVVDEDSDGGGSDRTPDPRTWRPRPPRRGAHAAPPPPAPPRTRTGAVARRRSVR
ncbi:MAG TPA: hypothetical protein VFD31_08305 [Thermoleophilaceae bacterium]|nr:hypothetical protein [Thermoleophilaceae bacterium]